MSNRSTFTESTSSSYTDWRVTEGYMSTSIRIFEKFINSKSKINNWKKRIKGD